MGANDARKMLPCAPHFQPRPALPSVDIHTVVGYSAEVLNYQ